MASVASACPLPVILCNRPAQSTIERIAAPGVPVVNPTMRTSPLPLALLMLHASTALPQAAGNLYYESGSRIHFQQAERPVQASVQGNTLRLEVNAMMNVRADSYLAIFHVMQLGQTAAEADSLLEARLQRLGTGLQREGVAKDDIFLDMLSFVPVYEVEATRKLFSTTYQEVPAGFEVQKNIHIRFNDARMLDKLVSAAAREEIYDLVKVDFFVHDQAAAYDTLRMFATRLMQRKLDAFGQLGLRMKEAHRTAAEATGAYFPLDRYTDYRSRTQVSLNSRRKGQPVNDIRTPSTLFYNKVPYGRFDLVLHAEITEPPVQYTYNLVLQCELPPDVREKEVKEVIKHVWITDKGEPRQLALP